MSVLTVPDRLERGMRPNPAQATAMREHYRRTGSKSAVCFRFYGYKNGDAWGYVMDALEGRL